MSTSPCPYIPTNEYQCCVVLICVLCCLGVCSIHYALGQGLYNLLVDVSSLSFYSPSVYDPSSMLSPFSFPIWFVGVVDIICLFLMFFIIFLTISKVSLCRSFNRLSHSNSVFTTMLSLYFHSLSFLSSIFWIYSLVLQLSVPIISVCFQLLFLIQCILPFFSSTISSFISLLQSVYDSFTISSISFLRSISIFVVSDMELISVVVSSAFYLFISVNADLSCHTVLILSCLFFSAVSSCSSCLFILYSIPYPSTQQYIRVDLIYSSVNVQSVTKCSLLLHFLHIFPKVYVLISCL